MFHSHGTGAEPCMFGVRASNEINRLVVVLIKPP